MRRTRLSVAAVVISIGLLGGVEWPPPSRAAASGLQVQGGLNWANVKWAFTTEGDASATPAVDSSKVYVPDWKGNLYAVDRSTGLQVWTTKISAATGLPGDKARATP